MIDCDKHTLNVITKNLPVALSTALSKTLVAQTDIRLQT